MKVNFSVIPFILASTVQAWSKPATVTVDTTSGRLSGTQAGGVASFKGIRFAQPPVNDLRWQPPVPFHSSDTHQATSLGPSCLQQFPSTLIMDLFNNPRHPPSESEDCLYLNVWAPKEISGPLKPVVVWIYGGGFTMGTASVPMYDGAAFAKNQDVVFVSFNYRTNMFGFPTASDLPSSGNNLGFLDQELALSWVQDNVAQFGGDKSKVTLMGQSAGAMSISLAITRRNSSVVPPFRSAILFSGEKVSSVPQPNFKTFDAVATAMGCSQSPGPERLQCLRHVPASTIHKFLAENPLIPFTPQVDNVTFIADSLQAIRTGQIPQVSVLLGGVEDEGTIFAPIYQNVSFFLGAQLGRISFYRPPNATVVNSLYPGLNDTQVLDAVIRDELFRCPTKLWSDALVTGGIKNVYRYTYGAKFPNLQPFNNLSVWHGSELYMVFGTFSKWTASADEIELSKTLQTAVASFVKDPSTPPVPNWPAYNANDSVPTLAKLAYHGNVEPGNVVDLVDPSTTDGPCGEEWDQFLDFRP